MPCTSGSASPTESTPRSPGTEPQERATVIVTGVNSLLAPRGAVRLTPVPSAAAVAAVPPVLAALPIEGGPPSFRASSPTSRAASSSRRISTRSMILGEAEGARQVRGVLPSTSSAASSSALMWLKPAALGKSTADEPSRLPRPSHQRAAISLDGTDVSRSRPQPSSADIRIGARNSGLFLPELRPSGPHDRPGERRELPIVLRPAAATSPKEMKWSAPCNRPRHRGPGEPRRPFSQPSSPGGQQQRAAIARGLVIQPCRSCWPTSPRAISTRRPRSR